MQTSVANISSIHGQSLQPIFEQEEDETQDQSLVPQPRAHQNIEKEWQSLKSQVHDIFKFYSFVSCVST